MDDRRRCKLNEGNAARNPQRCYGKKTVDGSSETSTMSMSGELHNLFDRELSNKL